METYFDSAEGITISRDRALRELSNHGITDPADVLEGLGCSRVSGDIYTDGMYDAQRLLAWLGY